MTLRARKFVTGYATEGQQEALSIVAVLPWNAELIEWAVVFSTAPTTGDILWIVRDANLGVAWDIPIVEFNPSLSGISYAICNEIWQFRKDDQIAISYTNTDDLGITFQAVFREAW